MSNKRLVPLNVYASATEPTVGSNAGDLYYNTNDSTLYVYTGSAWSAVTGSGGGGGSGVTASSTAPSSPTVGQGWFDTTDGTLYVYYDGYWVEPSNGGSVGPTQSDLESVEALALLGL